MESGQGMAKDLGQFDWCATGDESAAAAVVKELAIHRPLPAQLPRKRLGDAAKRLIRIGIANASLYPESNDKTCGGLAQAIFL